MHIPLDMNMNEYSCRFQIMATMSRNAEFLSDAVFLYPEIHTSERQLKCHKCNIYKHNSSKERMFGNVCLKNSLGSYIKQTQQDKTMR